MSGLKEIRNRISSISSTMQITSAMKMVSASKLKKAHDAVIALTPYSERTKEIVENIVASGIEDFSSVYTEERHIKKILIAAVTSNKGLCGAFNASVIKQVIQLAEQYKGNGTDVTIATIGKKGNDILKKSFDIFTSSISILENLNYEDSNTIANELLQGFQNKNYDKVLLVYNHSKNAATQIVKTEQFLPVIHQEQERGIKNGLAKDYIFEPSKAEILSSLIPKALKIEFYRVLRDSFASEHGARMTAMHKATDNAQDLKTELTLKYNKERQAAITNEILEIVGGAEALNG